MKKLKVVSIFLILFILTQNMNESFAETEILNQEQDIRSVGNNFRNACINYDKIKANILARQLISYGEDAIQIFEEVLWMEKFMAITTAAWGLSQIKSEKSLDILIKRYRSLSINNSAKKYLINSIGSINNNSAKNILESIVDTEQDITSKIIAASELSKYGNNRNAEDVLLKYAPLSVEALKALNKPELINTRRTEIEDVVKNVLRNPQISEWNKSDMILLAGDILINGGYQNIEELLAESFTIQNNIDSKNNIRNILERLNTGKAIQILEGIK